MFSLSKDATAAALDFSEWILLIFGLILCLGIVGEYVNKKWWTDRERLWQICVIVGVLGELLADGSIFLFSHRLQLLEGADIQQLNTKAAAALTDSNDAIKKAKGAVDESSTAKDESEKAKTLAGQASALANGARRNVASLGSEVASVKSQSGDLSVKLTDANRKADEELKARIQLESQLINVEICSAPRILPYWSTGGKTSIDPLKAMAGATVFIEFVADNEARRAAVNIANTLSAAKWDVRPLRMVETSKDGVDIQPYNPPLGELGFGGWQRAREVADVLIDFLHSYNWQAQQGWAVGADGHPLRDDNVMPPGSVRIQVGLYPPVVFVPPPGAKEISDALSNFRESWVKEREESERKLREMREKRLESIPPERRQAVAALEKEFEERNKKALNRYTNPCRDFFSPLPN